MSGDTTAGSTGMEIKTEHKTRNGKRETRNQKRETQNGKQERVKRRKNKANGKRKNAKRETGNECTSRPPYVALPI